MGNGLDLLLSALAGGGAGVIQGAQNVNKQRLLDEESKQRAQQIAIQQQEASNRAEEAKTQAAAQAAAAGRAQRAENFQDYSANLPGTPMDPVLAQAAQKQGLPIINNPSTPVNFPAKSFNLPSVDVGQGQAPQAPPDIMASINQMLPKPLPAQAGAPLGGTSAIPPPTLAAAPTPPPAIPAADAAPKAVSLPGASLAPTDPFATRPPINLAEQKDADAQVKEDERKALVKSIQEEIAKAPPGTKLTPEQRTRLAFAGVDPVKIEPNVPASATSGKGAVIADGITRGDIPPTVVAGMGFTREKAELLGALAEKGTDVSKLVTEWGAAQRAVSTLNGAQQVRLSQAIAKAQPSLDLIDELSGKLSASMPRSERFPIFNAAALESMAQGGPGWTPEAQQNAILLKQQIADVTGELATVIMGGYAPSDKGLQLAGANLNSNWTAETLKAAVNQARRNLSYAAQAQAATRPMGTKDNIYADQVGMGTPAAGGENAPPKAAPGGGTAAPTRSGWGAPIVAEPAGPKTGPAGGPPPDNTATLAALSAAMQKVQAAEAAGKAPLPADIAEVARLRALVK